MSTVCGREVRPDLPKGTKRNQKESKGIKRNQADARSGLICLGSDDSKAPDRARPTLLLLVSLLIIVININIIIINNNNNDIIITIIIIIIIIIIIMPGKWPTKNVMSWLPLAVETTGLEAPEPWGYVLLIIV